MSETIAERRQAALTEYQIAVDGARAACARALVAARTEWDRVMAELAAEEKGAIR